MKYCPKCGSELMDEAIFCPKCGCIADQNKYDEINNQNKPKSNLSALRNIAFAFMVVGLVSLLPFIFSLAWTIPMTIEYYHKINNKEKVSISFKICTLLFVSMIAGILMLIDED